MIIDVYNTEGKFIKWLTSPTRVFKGDYINIDNETHEVYNCVMVFDEYYELTHQEICIKEVI